MRKQYPQGCVGKTSGKLTRHIVTIRGYFNWMLNKNIKYKKNDIFKECIFPNESDIIMFHNKNKRVYVYKHGLMGM